MAKKLNKQELIDHIVKLVTETTPMGSGLFKGFELDNMGGIRIEYERDLYSDAITIEVKLSRSTEQMINAN